MDKHYTRRNFIKQTSKAGILTMFQQALGNQAFTASLKNIGLITNVIQDELKKDWQATLSKVAAIGYTYLEYGNYYGESREQFKTFMKKAGLQSLAGGTAMAQMIKEDDLKKIIADALALDKKYLVCYWPWMDNGNNKNIDDFKTASERLNKIGDVCHKEGIGFAFHNHDKEFVHIEGYQFGYELIMKETDPAKVNMLLDLYWITKGGGDPINVLQRFGNRIVMLHVKDMDNTSEKLYTCPGYGTIDFPKIFSVAMKAGVQYYTVEVDRHPQPLQCIQDSYTYLKNLRF